MKNFAESLSDVLMRANDLKAEADAIIEAAKAEGINVKALRKVAKELITDSAKLAKEYDFEQQLDMFRIEVGIFGRKGLSEIEKAASASNLVGDKKLKKAAAEFDAMAGTDLAKNYDRDRKAVNKWITKRAEADQ